MAGCAGVWGSTLLVVSAAVGSPRPLGPWVLVTVVALGVGLGVGLGLGVLVGWRWRPPARADHRLPASDRSRPATDRRSGRRPADGAEPDGVDDAAACADPALLAAVVAHTDSLVLITDAHGRTTWVNDAFLAVTGYRREDLLGRRPGAVLQQPATDPGTIATMREAITAGRSVAVEVLNRTAAGADLWLEMVISPVRDPDTGEIEAFVSVQHDITRSRQRESELQAARSAAELEAERHLALLATMSHDIRSPLHAVVGAAEQLATSDLDVAQQQYVQVAQDSARLLLGLLEGVVGYASVASDHLELHPGPTDLAAVLRRVTAMFAVAAEGQRVSLSAQLDPADAPAVLVDEVRLRQLLNNLVANALRFAPGGRVELRGRLVPVAADRVELHLAVVDDGVGIDPERLPTLFAPYTTYTHPTLAGAQAGTGLGLAISQRLVTAMGGTIEVASTPGQGTTFTVVLPLALVDDDLPGPAAAPHGPAADAADVLSGLRVLVVDDDPLGREVSLALLGQLGCETQTVPDAGTALAHLAVDRPDVVLSDVNLPDVSGTELVSRYRALVGDGPRPRLVALTASALPGDRDRLLAAGFDGYLAKPVGREGLAAGLRACLADAST